ncbi:glycosyl transferase family 2 [Oribacterium sp. C9]|uniref:glycosyltransferase family 2 protein n=1 Tax=Oribacterium sp. C9 TaxID=1943579 RepID=UPI00098FAD5D|nr:glycosyltransferase family 2 protein [Oribacterium sp. C9]OON88439.1 glycosyl transferase family 2 [Oribacterium sp. C9]
MRYKVDVAVSREGKITFLGWAFGKDPETPVKYTVLDGEGRPVEGTVVESVRRDEVAEAFFKDYEKEHGPIKRELGYDINTPYKKGETRYIVIEVDGKTRKVKFNDQILESFNSVAHKKREKLMALFHWETVEVAWEYFRDHGFRALWKKSVHRIKGIQEDYDYNEWYKREKVTEEELEKQRNTVFALQPKFSIVIPVYETPEKFLRKMLASIENQTYGNFEVCVADATPYDKYGKADAAGKLPKEVLQEFHDRDQRFRFKVLDRNLGISDNTNAAIQMAEGEFIVFADHDDELEPNALFECAKAVNEHPDAVMIYSDEDKIDFEDTYYFEPHFKSDFNPDLLRSVNYVCHLMAFKKELLEAIAEEDEEGNKVYERKAYDGAQDHDLILRAVEKAQEMEREKTGGDLSKLSDSDRKLLKEGRFTSSNICHIQKSLYHWRSHQASTAQHPEAKLYAFDAGARAVYDHCKRLGLPVKKVEKGITYGFYHTVYENTQPLISVIIPNKDHTADLDKAIQSLAGSNYKNLEFIVVENNSDQEETWKYYEDIQKQYPTVRVVKWKGSFNYSAINNFGVKFSRGEYILFLNNDIELIEPDSIDEMIGYVQREDVGICGARLLYPDEDIQHAGVIMGMGGIAGAAFVRTHDAELSYMHRAKCVQDYSCVTAACLLTKRKLFDEVGGFTEELAVAFNDVDFCMKIRALGKLVVYNPYAKFYHYESKSRGMEDTPEKVARFNSEIVEFAKRWPECLRYGDPYYNPALTFMKSNFTLKNLDKEVVGEPFRMDILEGIV